MIFISGLLCWLFIASCYSRIDESGKFPSGHQYLGVATSTPSNVDVNLREYLQPDTVGVDEKYDNLNENNGRLCSRNCTKFSKSRTCYYIFNVEQYHTMGLACQNCGTGRKKDCDALHCITANGRERMVYSINRRIPGPAIDVCYNDTIIVDVINRMSSETITIHWHGVLQQGTPWMDGVPYISQYPILPNNKFRYEFKALTNGTLLYHGHIGPAHANGVYGALTIRQPNTGDSISRLQDWDLPSHHIIIGDWTKYPENIYSPGYHRNSEHISMGPHDYLINGRGFHIDSNEIQVPLTQFRVIPTKRYRFRIVAATSSRCPFKVAIQDHPMSVVALDGYPCQVLEVDAVVMTSGQRTDVVINAKDETDVTYWVVVKGMEACESNTQAAYLVYGSSPPKPSGPPKLDVIFNNETRYLNNPEVGCKLPHVCSDEVQAPPDYRRTPQMEKLLSEQANQTFTFIARNHKISLKEVTEDYYSFSLPFGEQFGAFIALLNNVAGMLPPVPLNTRKLSENLPTCYGNCTDRTVPYCRCLNILEVELNNIVDLIFVDANFKEDGNFNRSRPHPIHIHGHHFTVVPKEKKQEDGGIFQAPASGASPLEGLIQRDTVLVPFDGQTRIRFLADNPGYWLIHCHYNAHFEGGMFIILKVGNDSQIPKPPTYFPKCETYTQNGSSSTPKANTLGNDMHPEFK